MADFVCKKNCIEHFSRLERIHTRKISFNENLVIFGEENTFFHIQREDEYIVVLGYCHFPGETIQNTLLKILNTFKESEISHLKIQLIGHFILVVKKGGSLFIFADFLHVRNLFYARDFSIVSSSFSVLEQFLGANFQDLNINKIVEYLAMIHGTYPSWLGNKTMHSKINFLKPYEYIVINDTTHASRLRNVSYHIDNSKESNINQISSNLLSSLKNIIINPSLKEQKIGITLTGGYDTRLIATLAVEYYKDVEFRLATSKLYPGSFFDSIIAERIATSLNIPIIIYKNMNNNSIENFYFITEGMSPIENSVIYPIITRTNNYSLGLGGCFGSELFIKMDWPSIDCYIDTLIKKAKMHIQVNCNYWNLLRSAMEDEFRNIRKFYKLAMPNPTDEARIFLLLRTAFFSSSMLSSYNIKGLELEPYGHYNILELALKVPKKLMGLPGRRIQNLLGRAGRFQTNLVQKKAMAKTNRKIGKIRTTHFQPMLPYSLRNFPNYAMGYLQGRSRQKSARKTDISYQQKREFIRDLSHTSNGWDRLFLRRIKETYNENVEI